MSRKTVTVCDGPKCEAVEGKDQKFFGVLIQLNAPGEDDQAPPLLHYCSKCAERVTVHAAWKRLLSE